MSVMFESFNGLPMHPLVVHAAVVLIPLTCLGTILIAVRRSWRRTLGWWVVGLAFVSVGAAFVAKESGEALAKVIGNPVEHAQLGNTLPIIAGVMFLATTALVVGDRWLDADSAGHDRQPVLVTVLAVIAVIVAVGATVQTVRVGDSGAKAVWSNVLKPAPQPSGSTSPTASASSSPKNGPTTYTLAQVKAHNKASDCWTAINSDVYNLTSWEDQHPGGASNIISLCGTNGTAAFTAQHGGQGRPKSELAQFKIGVLASQ